MPFPIFADPISTDRAEKPSISRNVAASRLGLAVAGVDKLVRAGILSLPISPDTVDRLAKRPQLRVESGQLTVLRTDARRDAHPGDDPLGRRYMGFHVDHTDAELEDTSLRWWRSSPRRILDNELWAVTVSTIPVAVYQITGVIGDPLFREGEEQPRYHYEGRLLARVYSGTGEAEVSQLLPPGLRTAAAQIMKSRIAVNSGGPMAYLDPDPHL
ncbi:hypothetical protein [Prescottella equi]|uniref:hypothetical protein n=1 Tax=Rhodococcus hoagii TaxID=43767 RepID=UPI000ADFAEA1|nr:hypothetical protein [Prescottella equi]